VEESSSNLGLLLVAWMAVAIVTVYNQWMRRDAGTGLILAYLLNLWLIHWPGAAIYLLPWKPLHDPSTVEAGFQQATYAVIGFGAGSIIFTPLCRRVFKFAKPAAIIHRPNPRLAQMYIVVGLVCFAILVPFLGGLPTITSLVSSGWNLLVAGLGLSCLQAWQEQKPRVFLCWLVIGLCIPLFTIISQGFASYGTAATIAFLAFVGTLYRHRWWKLALVGFLIGYLGLSFYVSYMRDRQVIRETFGGGQTLSNRLAQLYMTLSDFEWFDPSNDLHLQRIDDRLNQNHLVGAAVNFLGSGAQDFAQGDTLWEALLALVPRAVWPDKPIVAGSGNLVTTYTGISFAEGTSVGIGQVIEFYVNFGDVGVILGFFVIGMIITVVDWSAYQSLKQGDWERFIFWYLPGLSLLQVGGSLMEVTSSAAAAAVLSLLLHRYLMRRTVRRKPQLIPEQFDLPSSPVLRRLPRSWASGGQGE
jgi:hypothetical protein